MKFKLALLVVTFATLATAAHAQGGTVASGCGSSPENPTAILALVGSAGGVFAALRSRFRSK